ncbi:hypothetical protein PAECIP111802_06923 [Paenibacillus allorhizosphaerae]|uniref:Uncharacterized protein n=1 Tax=Paenibacillus allorhizosphaerae TaxID=2849866 RepID=A0ABM8VU10_9BACL|nr:hypothetical protein PAECIP111802_06923 [Paenibacillus allorhizosphaerae]
MEHVAATRKIPEQVVDSSCFTVPIRPIAGRLKRVT